MPIYSAEFFRGHEADSRDSAREVIPFVCELIRPQSVVDIGCGVGAWLSVFQEQGVTEILGVDGEYVEPSLLHIPPERFRARDLTRKLVLEERFDLAVSVEVAEHLPESAAEMFVDTLTSLAPVILFSAAIPHQSGEFHINEQWQNYWVARFQRRNYVKIDCLRWRFWDNQKVAYWYAQNMFLFARQDYFASHPRLQAEQAQSPPLPECLVHPSLYLAQNACVSPEIISFKRAFPLFWNSIRNSLRRRLPGVSGH